MIHRKRKKRHGAEESVFQILFLVLLFLSILRILDLLPEKDKDPQPVSAVAAFDPASIPPESNTVPSPQRSLSVYDVETVVSSGGLDLRGMEPKILIYHTHTTEAYTATKASPYVKTGSFRTADASKSVLAVGEALAERLRTHYGFCVIHDTTDHEPPSLKTAYERSEKTMRSYLEQYPSLILFIDIHRDASSDASDYVMVDGMPTARLMCVVGQGTKYEEKPDFDRNYDLASKLTQHLRKIEKRLARDVRVKTGRYNQHVGSLSLLIEVGHNANTLEQALHAVPSLAECLALALAETDMVEPPASSVTALSHLLVPCGAGIDKE